MCDPCMPLKRETPLVQYHLMPRSGSVSRVQLLAQVPEPLCSAQSTQLSQPGVPCTAYLLHCTVDFPVGPSLLSFSPPLHSSEIIYLSSLFTRKSGLGSLSEKSGILGGTQARPLTVESLVRTPAHGGVHPEVTIENMGTTGPSPSLQQLCMFLGFPWVTPCFLLILDSLRQVSARVPGLQSKGEGPLAGMLPEVPGIHAAVCGLLPPPCPGLARNNPRWELQVAGEAGSPYQM